MGELQLIPTFPEILHAAAIPPVVLNQTGPPYTTAAILAPDALDATPFQFCVFVTMLRIHVTPPFELDQMYAFEATATTLQPSAEQAMAPLPFHDVGTDVLQVHVPPVSVLLQR